MADKTLKRKDDLKECILHMIEAMKTDYGFRFKSTFSDKDELRNYKRRLYSKLRDRDITCIYNAYDAYVDSENDWPPTVPELLKHLALAEKQALRDKANAQKTLEATALPPPARQIDFTGTLKEAISHSDKTDKEAWLKRKADIYQNHRAIIELNRSKIRQVDTRDIECAVADCHRPGTVSHGLRGDGSFYCMTHFKR